jgi:hypothetical protein
MQEFLKVEKRIDVSKLTEEDYKDLYERAISEVKLEFISDKYNIYYDEILIEKFTKFFNILIETKAVSEFGLKYIDEEEIKNFK